MDVVMIASAAVSLLSPYLSKAAGKFADAATEAALNKTGELYKLLKERLAGTPAHSALTEVEKAPDDTTKQAALSEELKNLIGSDPDFMKRVTTLLDAIGKASGQAVFNNQFGGNVEKVIQIGSANDIEIN